MIFETHAHYDDEQFREDLEDVLSDVCAKGISPIINVGASIDSSALSIALAERHKDIYAAIGVHPSEIGGLSEDAYAWLRGQSEGEKIAAIGEIGLDYHWEKDAKGQEKQRYWFARQLELARETGLPVIIHSRDAAADTMSVMKECNAQTIPGVIHCYSYSKELAMEFVEMGYYIGIGGVITFSNARKLAETAAVIPMERILLETDCPYLAPEPNRGKRNDSRNLIYVAEKIAQIRGISTEEIEKITEENAYRLFTKVKRS